MLYNNPIAYGTDFAPEQIARARAARQSPRREGVERRRPARHGDRASVLGDRLAHVRRHRRRASSRASPPGRAGWVAGLVNALPEESVLLFEHAMAGRAAEARRALRLVPAAAAPRHGAEVRAADQAGAGRSRARAASACAPPRLELAGAEREMALAMIRRAARRRGPAPAPRERRRPTRSRSSTRTPRASRRAS